jgi:hypothetical protein
MTRWAIRFSTTGKRSGTAAVKRWQFVAFAGPLGGESRGIVDLVAVRRDHHTTMGRPFLRGDLFEIVFVQIKGGSAAWPTVNDLVRLRAVQRRYRAKAVVLASWRKGTEPTFYVLKRGAWEERSAASIFGE